MFFHPVNSFSQYNLCLTEKSHRILSPCPFRCRHLQSDKSIYAPQPEFLSEACPSKSTYAVHFLCFFHAKKPFHLIIGKAFTYGSLIPNMLIVLQRQPLHLFTGHRNKFTISSSDQTGIEHLQRGILERHLKMNISHVRMFHH